MVYLDAKSGELPKLLSGDKTMIIRGAAGRIIPSGRVSVGDFLYLAENDGGGLVQAKTKTVSVFNSEKTDTGESTALVFEQQDFFTTHWPANKTMGW